MTQKKNKKISYIKLTSHVSEADKPKYEIRWGEKSPSRRGPIIGTTADPMYKNVIGTYSGSYSVYKALAVARGSLDENHKPDFTDTAPVVDIPMNHNWRGDNCIVSMDPFGATVSEDYSELLRAGVDVRPTIAVTKAHLHLPEIKSAVNERVLKPDGIVLKNSAEVVVTKAAIDPVWYLPGLARRFGVGETGLRQELFKHTGGMFPELITRPDLHVFLPPIGGATLYLFGDPSLLRKKTTDITCRVHDECNGSDVFGSDICTCRPYLTYGIEECIKQAQAGGLGIVLYNRKEGRALGEVTKYLVYNARKRQKGGDRADTYFSRTECVAGVQDVRFQELMPDPLLWLGVNRIHKFVSMSNMKFEALSNAGISVDHRITIPEDMIPEDAQVEISAKKAAGYYSDDEPPTDEDLRNIKGRAS